MKRGNKYCQSKESNKINNEELPTQKNLTSRRLLFDGKKNGAEENKNLNLQVNGL